MVKAEKIARRFHEVYEELAPKFSYETRPGTKKPWDEVPKNNKDLMIATAEVVLNELQSESFDRIERMLRWLTVKSKMENRGQLAGMNYDPEAMGKQVDELVGQLPDISDIIEEGK